MSRRSLALMLCFLLVCSALISTAKIINNVKNDNWDEIQKLLASDGADGDQFGFSVSIDSDYLLIGAIFNDENGEPEKDNNGCDYLGIINDDVTDLLLNQVLEQGYFKNRGYQLINQFGIDQ